MVKSYILVYIFLASLGSIAIYSELNEDDVASQLTELEINWQRYRLNIHAKIELPVESNDLSNYVMRSYVKEIVARKVSSSMENLVIDNEHKLMDMLDSSVTFRREYPMYLDSMEISSVNYRNNSIYTRAVLPIRGSNGLLSRIPIEWETVRYSSLEGDEYITDVYNESSVNYEYKRNSLPIDYTGLIVDIRGQAIQKAVVPRIFSQSGRLIYGPEFINRKIGTVRGLVSYVKSLNDPEVAIRAGSKPYFTAALSMSGKFNSDPVIAETEVANFLESTESIKNLLKCRVIFLVD